MRVVITGTSRGIGLELSRIVLDAGHQLIAVARDPARSEGLAGLARAHPHLLRIVPFDLQDPDITDAIGAVARDWNCVDVLVNNAGILRQGQASEDFMDSFAINAVV